MNSPVLPFTEKILKDDHNLLSNSTALGFSIRLPATTRSGRGRDNIIVPHPDPDFLTRELSVRRINDVQGWLWICGRPMPPRPLHQQLVLSRNIVICEDVGLHMVWYKDRIYLKPIPLYLLDPDFWAAHLVTLTKEDKERRSINACALGFLYSYTALVAYQSDFKIAQDTGLLPKDIEWHEWQSLTAQLLANHCHASVNPRYWYGELRLSRLNAAYVLGRGAIFRMYSRVGSHTAYEGFLHDNLAVVATILGYTVIVLTAMQVGLQLDKLRFDQSFVDMSYGFTVLSIVAPLAAVAFVCFFLMIMIISNWRETKRYERERFREMGVEADWMKKR